MNFMKMMTGSRAGQLAASFVAASAVAATAFAVGGAPAQASEGIGSGRALIHIDAPTATVVKTGKNSYRMILPPDSSGQWMGERTDAAGVTQTRVGDLTAKKLSTKWTKFRHSKASVLSTLAWSTGDGKTSSALAKLSRPVVTDAGVRFDFTSKFPIPGELEDVSINLRRAPEKRASRASSDFQISDQLYIDTYTVVDNEISTRIYNKSNNNTCWTGDGAKVVSIDDFPNAWSVTTNTCDNIKYENMYAATPALPAYGLKVVWPALNLHGQWIAGTVNYYLDVTPPGQSAFAFSHAVMSWTP